MAPDTRLKDVAQDILDNVATGLTMAGLSVPSRRYIHAGQIAQDFIGEDCAGELIVGWNGVGVGTGQPSSFIGAVVQDFTGSFAQFTIALLRCAPTVDSNGTPPTATELQATGEEVLIDAMTLFTVVLDEHLAGTLTDIGCQLMGIGNIQPIGPQGGATGTSVTLLIGLV